MNKTFFFLVLFLWPNLWSAEISPIRSLGVFAPAQRDGFLPSRLRSPRPIRLEDSEPKLVAMPSIYFGDSSPKRVYRTTTGEFGSLPLILHLGNRSPKRTYLVKPDAFYWHKKGCKQTELLFTDTACKADFQDVIQTVTKNSPYELVCDEPNEITPEDSYWIKLEQGYVPLLYLCDEFEHRENVSAGVELDQNEFFTNFLDLNFKRYTKYMKWFSHTKAAFFNPSCIDSFFEDMKTICGKPDLKIDEKSYFKIGAICTYFKMGRDDSQQIMFNPITGKFFGIYDQQFSFERNIIEELSFAQCNALKGINDIDKQKEIWDTTLNSIHARSPIKDQKMFERVTTFLKYFKAVDAAFNVEAASIKYSAIQKQYAERCASLGNPSYYHQDYFEGVKERAQIIIKDLEGMIKEYNDRSFFNNHCMELGRMFESFQE